MAKEATFELARTHVGEHTQRRTVFTRYTPSVGWQVRTAGFVDVREVNTPGTMDAPSIEQAKAVHQTMVDALAKEKGIDVPAIVWNKLPEPN